MIHLQRKMHNDATVTDWLGTAATAARVAANRIDCVREERVQDASAVLDVAISDLEQALEEARAVRATGSWGS